MYFEDFCRFTAVGLECPVTNQDSEVTLVGEGAASLARRTG
jgi:hypothetical protein